MGATILLAPGLGAIPDLKWRWEGREYINVAPEGAGLTLVALDSARTLLTQQRQQV